MVPWAHISLRPNSNRYALATMTLLIYIIFYIYFDRSSTFAGLTVASNMPKSYALNFFNKLGSPSKVPFPVGDLDPLLTHGSLDPQESTPPNCRTCNSAIFARLTATTYRQTMPHRLQQQAISMVNVDLYSAVITKVPMLCKQCSQIILNKIQTR